MKTSLIVASDETLDGLLSLRTREGWEFERDVMPSAVRHRTWSWRVRGETQVVYWEDRRFGGRGFLVEGPLEERVERELREVFDFHEPEELFALAHDPNREDVERMRALFETTLLVGEADYDEAYKEMLAGLIESGNEAMARAALMIAERLRWEGLSAAVARRLEQDDLLFELASRVAKSL